MTHLDALDMAMVYARSLLGRGLIVTTEHLVYSTCYIVGSHGYAQTWRAFDYDGSSDNEIV